MQWKKSERITKARRDLWKKMDENDPTSQYIIEMILQRVFTKEELQNKNNIKFGVIVSVMILDPMYDQVEIVSSKVQEHMDKWEIDPIVERWVSLIFIYFISILLDFI